MIIALFALSIAMIVGGIASVVQGFPFVRLESGLAMTIAGATTASAGAVLLGLAVVAAHVRGLGRRLAEAAKPAPAAAFVPPREVAHDPMPHNPDRPGVAAAEPASRRPVIAGAAGLAAGAAGSAHLGAADARAKPEPTFEEPPAPSAAEPMLPDLLPPPENRQDAGPAAPHRNEIEGVGEKPQHDPSSRIVANEPEPAKPEPEESDGDLFAAPEPEPEAPALRPALDDVSTPPPAPEAEPVEASLDVVGTYVSGGNTYVMFSDGSIEAETPRGRFTFESLEELKAFVEAGGEGETRGVA